MSHIPIHHPADETLLRHAAGRLPAGQALVVATHLLGCPHCRAAIRMGEAVGGALLADTPPTDLAPAALARTLARLDMPASMPAPIIDDTELSPGVRLPVSLRGLLGGPWRWVAPGINRIRLNIPGVAPGERAYLLRVAPGTHLPAHGHHGAEITCVLAGRFTDITGSYGPGDVAEMDADRAHQPMADTGETCICLIASQGRLRMHGLLARLVQPLVGV